jgi:O-antigen/teichoic acid export membrane protein
MFKDEHNVGDVPGDPTLENNGAVYESPPDITVFDGLPIEQHVTWIIPVVRDVKRASGLEPQGNRFAHTNTTAEPRKAVAAGVESQIVVLRRLVKDSGIYALSALILPLITLILAPFLTHHLSPSDYGRLTVLNTSISLTVGVTQLGLGSAFFRASAYDYTSSGDRRYVLGTVTILLFLASLATLLGATVMAPLLAQLFFGQSSLGGLFILAATVVFLQNLTVPGVACLRLERRALIYSLLSISNLLITLVANFVLVGVLHLGLAGSLLATVCGYASVLICTVPLILLRATLRVRTDIARSVLTYGLPLIFNLFSYWVLQLSDRYLLSLFTSYAETARYAVAYTLAQGVSLAMGPFTLAWPLASFEIAKREDAAQIFKITFRWFSMFMLFATFGGSLVGGILLDGLFPLTYHSAANIIPIVALSVTFDAAYYVFMTGANVTRKTWLAPIFTTTAALVNVAVNLVLIPFLGAMGAALSTLVAFVVYAAMAYVVNRRIYPIRFEIGKFIIALLLGAALYGGSVFLGRGFGTYAGWAISFCTLIFYGGCLALLGLGSSRRSLLTGLKEVKTLIRDWRTL